MYHAIMPPTTGTAMPLTPHPNAMLQKMNVKKIEICNMRQAMWHDITLQTVYQCHMAAFGEYHAV